MDLRHELERLQDDFQRMSETGDEPRADYFFMPDRPEQWTITGGTRVQEFKGKARRAARLLPLIDGACSAEVMREPDPEIIWVRFVQVAVAGSLVIDPRWENHVVGTMHKLAHFSTQAIDRLLERVSLGTPIEAPLSSDDDRLLRLEKLAACVVATDTETDIGEKSRNKSRKRLPNKDAVRCGKLYRRELEKDPGTTLKSAVEMYLVDHPGVKREGLYKRLIDNPDLWKPTDT